MEENIDKCLDEQRVLIGEREKLIDVIERGNDELKRLEAGSAEFYEQHPDYCGSNDHNNNNVRSSGKHILENFINYNLNKLFFFILTGFY